MWLKIIPILIFPLTSQGRMECSESEYKRCTRIARPLLKEPDLVFPDNMNDIDEVCRTWNQFVDCLEAYTDVCFTLQQRKQFKKAVESPIESVHEMCMQPSYQREYLQYAPCIKNMIIERIHCGLQYDVLVDQVEQGEYMSKSSLCCSHDSFKQCIQGETRRVCDRGVSDGPASRFATEIIDKALSFLQNQCHNYIPNSGDCMVPYTGRSDPLVISTSSSEVYPWSTVQHDAVQKEILPDRVTPPRPPTPSTWLPSSMAPPAPSGRVPSTDASSTSMLGSRSRPASYGRASSWSSENTSPIGGNTVQMFPDTPSTPSSRPDWATVRTWDVKGQAPVVPSGTTRNFDTSSVPYGSSSTSSVTDGTNWYPAAGDQKNNEVEEPNQLGLQKPQNGGMSPTGTLPLALSVVSLFIAIQMF